MPRDEGATFGRPARARARDDHVRGQMILRVHSGAVQPVAGAARLRFSRAEADLLPESVAQPLDYLQREAGLRSVVPMFSTTRLRLQRSGLRGGARQKVAVLSSVTDSESEELAGIS